MFNKKQMQENIISLLGLGALPDKQKIAIIEKMSDLVQKRVGLYILEKLNETEQQVFIEATESDNQDKIKEILNNKKIDLVSVLDEEIKKLKQEMSEAAGLA